MEGPQQAELPPPADFQRLGSVATYGTDFSIETYDKSLVYITEVPSDPVFEHEEQMIQDEQTCDEDDDILEYHYPLVEENADDSSLAARDSLALQPGNNLGGVPLEVLQHPAPEDSERRGRRSLWLLICLLTVALILTLSIAIPRQKKEREGNNEAFLEDASQQGGDVQGQEDMPSMAPSASHSLAPTAEIENTLEFQTLKPKVENPMLLLDPSTPQGQAFQLILVDGLTNPFLITQRFALLVLYFSTGGPDWEVNLGWEQLSPEECHSWVGLNGCRFQQDDDYRAASVLELETNNLSGFLPTEICLLEKLENIVFPENSLKGPLPDCLSSLQNLKEINVYNNQFSGPIPAGILSMPSLLRLDLSSNAFSGSIGQLFDAPEDAQLYAFETLKTLKLDNNNFSGETPTDLFFIGQLETLTLHSNMLTGTLNFFCPEDDNSDINTPTTLTADCLDDVVECSCCTECF